MNPATIVMACDFEMPKNGNGGKVFKWVQILGVRYGLGCLSVLISMFSGFVA